MFFLTPIYLSIISRICGSECKWLGLFLYPIPYILLTNNYIEQIFIFIWVFMFKLTGHADGFKDYVRNNFLSRFVVPIANKLNINRNSQKYDFLFWFIKGGLIVLLPAILTKAISLFLYSAIGYPLAYFIGYNILNNKFFKYPNTWGEILGGFIAGLGFIL